MRNILIIGAAGKMGKWFFEYFMNTKKNLNQKDTASVLSIDKIFLYDIKNINYGLNFKDKNIVITNNLSESGEISDIVIFCIPVSEIIKIINGKTISFKHGAIIIEISSIKSAIHKVLLNTSNNFNVTTLCIHPMFGPGSSISATNKIIYIPVDINKSEIEEDLINELFPSFEKIIIKSPDKHDLAISVIISVIYFINLVFSKFIVEMSNSKEFQFEDNLIHFLKKISGSTFKIQSLLSESILTDDVSLFLTLFIDNDKSITTIDRYGQLFNDLLGKIEKKDTQHVKEYILSVRNTIEKDIDINHSYYLLYKFLNS
jgi:prephenate dehydrogenase